MHSIIFILCDAAPDEDHAVNPAANLTDDGLFDIVSTYNGSIDYTYIRDEDGKKKDIEWAKYIDLLKDKPNGEYSLVEPIKWFEGRIKAFREDAEHLTKITDEEFVGDIHVRFLLDSMSTYYDDRHGYIVAYYPYDKDEKMYVGPYVYSADDFVRNFHKNGKKYIVAATADYHY